MNILQIKLHWQILIALITGCTVGIIFGENALIFAPLGEIFMRLLKMIIVPLIFTSIVTGVSSVGTGANFTRLGLKTLCYYFCTSIIAIFIGLSLTNIIHPGNNVNISSITGDFNPNDLQKPDSLGDIIIRMIPINPISSAASGDMLGIIFFALIFGFGITMMNGDRKNQIINWFEAVFQIMMNITLFIIKLAPIGVFGLIIKAIATSGLDIFKAVGLYIVTIATGLTIHLFIILPLIFYIFTKTNPLLHFKAMASALAMAFSTSSSGATLPVTINCVKNKVGVSNKISSFVLPLGATVNMDGTALYECAGVLFIAQVLGIPLDFTQQLIIVITAFLASVGAAGIPSAGLVMIFIVLDSVGLGSHAGVGIIVGTMLAVDRPLDMVRTMVNVFSDSVGSAIIAKSEGEDNLYRDIQ